MSMRESILAGTIALGLIGATGGLLVYLQANQALGEPGVRLVPKPVYDPEGKQVGTHSVDLPNQVLNYTSTVPPVARIVLEYLPADTTYGQRIYTAADGFSVQFNVIVMGADRTSLHDPNYCLPGQGWRIDQDETISIPMSKPHRYELPAHKMTLSHLVKSDGRQAVQRGIYMYWFAADKQVTADHAERMAQMAWELIRSGGLVRPGKLQRWAYVTAFAVCVPGQEEATARRMTELIQESVPQFQVAAGAPVSGERKL